MSKIIGIKNFKRGDTRKYKLQIKDKDTGNPVSVHNGTLYVTFKSDKSMPDNEAEIQVIVNCIEPDPANPLGEIQVVLSSDDTNILPGSYYYDFQFVSSTGEVTTILPTEDHEERVKILEDVTRTH
jgi:hypothetical protein